MAQPITWQNVGMAPAYGATELMGMAQDQYANAFKGLGDIIQGVKNHNLAEEKANSEAQFNWFTEQARNLKPEQFTPETMNALLATLTDPAARQAAVESFGQLGDEATNRAFNQEKRQAFNADEVQKSILRPIEVDKAKQGLRLGEAQIKSEEASAASSYASAEASRANAAASNLRTEALRLELTDAKDERAKLKAGEKLLNNYGVSISTGVPPATVIDQIVKDPNLSMEQKDYLVKGVNSFVNTMNTLDPVTQKEVTQKLTTLDTNHKDYVSKVQTTLKDAEAKLPVEPMFSQVVGQEDVNKKVKDIVTTATGGTTATFSGGQDDLPTYINKGLDATAKDFVKQLDIALTPHIKDPDQRAAIIAEEMRGGGLQRIQSLALNSLIPTGDEKQIELSSDGKEIVTEFNRMIKPYAVSVANGFERRKLATEANAKILKATQAKNEEVEKLNSTIYQTKQQKTDTKAAPDLVKSIGDALGKLFPGSDKK